MIEPLLIGINTGGRLGNHLFTFAWMIEMARRCGAVAINPGFAAYKDVFESSSSQRVAFWPATAQLNTGTHALLLLLNPFFLRLYHHFRITRQWRLDEAKPILRRTPWIQDNVGFIAHDWLVSGRHAHRNLQPTFLEPDGQPDYFSERIENYIHTKRFTIFDSAAVLSEIPGGSVEILNSYFRPRLQARQAAEDWMRTTRAKTDVVIGVAVRQGDFKTWGGGANFVDPSYFLNILRGAVDQMCGRRCLFVVCSDEPISATRFPGIDAIAVPGDDIQHWCTLQKCDYIIGTAQSTFYQWASFLGNVPWYPVSSGAGHFPTQFDQLRPFGRKVVDLTPYPASQSPHVQTHR